MLRTVEDWLREGEELYRGAMNEYQAIEAQLDELEGRLAAKQGELNRIAQIIGKPPVENSRRLTAQLVSEGGPNSIPNSPSSIARALAGRGLAR